MATIYDLKPKFQGLLRPAVGALARAGVTPNQVTVAALLLSLATGAALYAWHGQRWVWLLVPAVLFLRMALNAIDGMLAREHDMATPLGAVLNELGDVVADAGLYLPFAVLAGVRAELVGLVVLLAVLSEMTGVIGVQIGASRRYDGPLGKSDRAFGFGLLATLVAAGVAPGGWFNWLLLIMALLLVVTVVNRARRAVAEVG